MRVDTQLRVDGGGMKEAVRNTRRGWWGRRVSLSQHATRNLREQHCAFPLPRVNTLDISLHARRSAHPTDDIYRYGLTAVRSGTDNTSKNEQRNGYQQIH